MIIKDVLIYNYTRTIRTLFEFNTRFSLFDHAHTQYTRMT